MLWAVIATVISPLSGGGSGPVASTYDEAACSEAEKVRPADDDVNCSEPEPVPAVLDCNDARVSVWLGDMIGSCDMPKSQLPGTLPVVRAAGPGADQRLCRDGHCGVDAVPIRPVARTLDDFTPILGAANLARPIFQATDCPLRTVLRRSQHGAERLERPPRAA
jgi:hypothetical protein